MVSRSILAFEFIEDHEWLLSCVDDALEDDFPRWSRAFCDSLCRIDREDI